VEDGKDFIVTGTTITTIFAGQGDDFIYGSETDLPESEMKVTTGRELGTQDGAPRR
jgi:hypothetical protein